MLIIMQSQRLEEQAEDKFPNRLRYGWNQRLEKETWRMLQSLKVLQHKGTNYNRTSKGIDAIINYKYSKEKNILLSN